MSRDEVCPKCTCREVIGHVVRGVYDGVLFWSCTNCLYGWTRLNWPPKSGVGVKAAHYAHHWNLDRYAPAQALTSNRGAAWQHEK